MLLMPPCSEVQANLTEYLEGALPWHRRLGIRVHLMLCHACSSLRNALAALPGFGKRALEAPALPGHDAQDAFHLAMKRIKEAKGD
jgi:anti-sigma factor ChrR (cupin superfamily)